MIIVKVNKINQAVVVKQAVAVLKQGGVVVYPTETAYGLGADFFNPRAVKKVYQIKGRDFKKPLAVIIGSLPAAKKLVKFDNLALKLAKKYWPGPLTLVLPIQAKVGMGLKPIPTLAVRISSNKLAGALVKKLGRPLSATSANLAGQSEIYSAAEVVKQFANKKYQPDLIIDAGKLPKVKVSTIVKIAGGAMEILRAGKILPKV